MSEQLSPQVRFKGFDDEWVLRQLDDLVTVVGGGTPSTTIPAFWGGGIDWLSPSEIGDEPIAPRSRTRLTAEGLAKSSAQLLPAGRTVLFTSRASIGHAALLKHSAATNQGFQSFVVRPGADVLFIHALTPLIKNYALTRASGSTFLEISARALREMPVQAPTLVEQERMGSFFAELDSLINEHRRKHRQLKQTKIALMQRMFPQDDAAEPEIRLKEFTGVWTVMGLGSLGTPFGGLTGKSKADFGVGDARYVTYMDVFRNPRILDASRCGAIGVDSSQQSVKRGDIFFTVSSETPDEVGMSSVWMVDREGVYLNSFCFGLRPSVEVDSSYLAYALRSTVVRKQFVLLAQGISRFNISKRKAMSIEVPFPSLSEQQAIGAFFSRFDDLIAAEEQYVTKLQQVKTSLLQKMFV